MTLLIKIAVGLAVIGAAAWGLFSFQAPTQTNTQGGTEVQQTKGIQATGSTQVVVGGSTDAALTADLNSIDTQLQAASNESASVDEGLNDTPVAQTE